MCLISMRANDASSSTLRLHFGLGSAESIEAMEIRWPNGLVENLSNIPVNTIHKVIEGKGLVQ